jgi:hypothetical protein
MIGIELEMRGTDPETFEAATCAAAKSITADAAGDNSIVTQQAGHIGEVCGRAAELLAFWEHVPKEFAQADREVILVRHDRGEASL